MELSTAINQNIQNRYTNQHLVSSSIRGFIIFAVHVSADNAMTLNIHVVDSCRNSPCADTVGDATTPCDLHRVRVRISDEDGDGNPPRPAMNRAPWLELEGNETGYGPYLGPDSIQRTLIKTLED